MIGIHVAMCTGLAYVLTFKLWRPGKHSTTGLNTSGYCILKSFSVKTGLAVRPVLYTLLEATLIRPIARLDCVPRSEAAPLATA